MADNKQIKDGVGNLFTIRMRDLSSAGDGSIQRSMIFSTGYPIDYGVGGMYQHCGKSGVMAAGLAANSPIYAFQATGNLLTLIRRIRLSAWSLAAFTAGIATFDLYAARGFTVQDGGGVAANLSGDAAQLRTAMNASLASVTYAGTTALSPGTRTLDPDPLHSLPLQCPGTGNAALATALDLFLKQQGDHPLFFVQNEGFVIRASVPATGTWGFSVTTEWDEVVVY